MREQRGKDLAQEREIEPQAAVAEHTHDEQQDRFVGSKPTAAPLGEHGATASQLAYEEDDNERELKTKVGALVQHNFGGDYKKAFAHYDTDGDGSIGKSELVKLLADAGVGSGFTRGVWASKIIERLDKSSDSKIEWSEFESVFTAAA